MSLLITNARVVTPRQSLRDRRGALAGSAMQALDVLPAADVLCEHGVFTRILPAGELARNATSHVLDAKGRVLLPGFVDCHTHACFAGSRLDEWQQKLAGASYLDILKAGGGLHSSVRATRAASEHELATSLRERAARMLTHGTTTLEVKSGYGLLPDAELRMLRAIVEASRDMQGAQTLVATALLGHALDPSLDQGQFVEAIVSQALPSCAQLLASVGQALSVDVYVEQGAWSLAQTARLFAAADALGARLRAHADQFTCQGLVEASISAASGLHASCLPRPLDTLDHLEATPIEVLASLGRTPTIAVLLPCTGLHTDQRYTNARPIIDSGGAVAVATNFNPGTSPCFSMPMAMALGVRCNRLSIAEALSAGTANAAAALALPDRGCIAPTQRADAVLLDTRDERSLVYEFGGNPVAHVLSAGKQVF
jgi:imidazolonepropionase